MFNLQLLDQLWLAGPLWVGVAASLLAIVAVLILRRFLPAEQRQHGMATMCFLILTVVLRLSAAVALNAGAYTVWALLSFLNIISLVLGFSGLAHLIVFDIALPRTRVQVPSVLRDLMQASVVLLLILTILYQRGFDPLSLLATSAVLTAVIGLALQNTIANFFAGLGLQIDRTFSVGDWVQVGDRVGRIAEIKWHSTALRTDDGDSLMVPNDQLVNAEVLNFSQPDGKHRLWVRVGFHYRHPPNEVKQVLLDAVRDTPGVLATPAPDCVLLDFADSAIVYALRYWITDFARRVPIESAVRTHLWYAARRAKLEIPFPIRTIMMPPAPEAEVKAVRGNGVADSLW
ncbi:MAG: mechanosensitive ion channel family protein [Candidatus Binatia bacterium]